MSSHKECEGCGWCCKYHMQVASKDAQGYNQNCEFFEVRQTGGSFEIETGKVFILPQPCPHYNENEDKCMIYEKRPKICRIFPQVYNPIMARYCKLMRKVYG